MAEAPDVEQFAQQNSNIKMVGVGGLDDLAYAERFQSGTGATFQLTWADSLDSWRALGVSRQHTVIVFDAEGNQLDTWRGFDGDRILEALG